MADEITATVSLQRKINLGNYESADVFVSVSNVTQETTEEELVALLDGPAQATYMLLAERVKHRAATIRSQKEV